MIRLILFVALIGANSLYAGLSVENEKDRIILEKSYVHAADLLSKNIRDKVGSDIIKFCAWLNPEHEGVKAIRAKLVFGDPVTAVGKGDGVHLAKLLMFRQKDFDEASKRVLYTIIANKVDPNNVDATVQIKEFKDQGQDLSLTKAIKDSEKPKLVDLAAVAEQKKAENIKIEQQNKELTTGQSASSMSVGASSVDEMLDLIKFKLFVYSEASFLDAINRLTHKMYWRGVQFTISGRRISYTEVKKAANGAIYYFGPLFQPRTEEFTLKNKTLRDILDHMGKNMDLEYKVKDGEVAFYDTDLPEFTDIPEEGLAANDLQRIMKDYKIKDLQKYRGKAFKMNGIVTGLGRGMDSRVVFLALDGGLIQLYATRASLEQDVYKRLDHDLEVWKKDGGLKKYREKLKEMEKTGQEVERKDRANPKLYVTFVATCKGIDKGRLIFDKPQYIYVEGPEEYLLRKEN